jgi:tetratricopeptide (TPR) repeat protein
VVSGKGFQAAIAAALIGVSVQTHADCKLERFAELPVTMVGTRPVVAGSVNGVDALFVADSGAFFSMLTREAAERFKLKWEPLPPWINVRGVKGGDIDVRLGVAKDFALTGYGTGSALHGVDFLVGGNAFGEGAAGLIGQNVLGRTDTEYDLGNGVIRLLRSKDCGNQVLAYWARDTAIAVVKIHETTAAEPHLVGEAMLNGAKIGIMFDTGAARSLLSFRGARRAGVKLDGPDVEPGGAWQGLRADAFQTWITRFDTLDLGGELIRNARLRIADVDVPGGADLTLGADFFLSHRIYVATNQHKIYFTYNGGHVFDLRPIPAATATAATATAATDAPVAADAAAAPPATGEPTDASGFRRRGAALIGRGEIARGIADLDRAIELDPRNTDSYSQRGLARWHNGDTALAMSDFDEALRLKPDDVPVLVERGSLRMTQADVAGARVDFDRAETLAPNDATVSFEIAGVYAYNRHFGEAMARYQRWLIAHPKDDRVGYVLGERCWMQAFSGEIGRAHV